MFLLFIIIYYFFIFIIILIIINIGEYNMYIKNGNILWNLGCGVVPICGWVFPV